jgi:hypothetical protein
MTTDAETILAALDPRKPWLNTYERIAERTDLAASVVVARLADLVDAGRISSSVMTLRGWDQTVYRSR